MPHFLLDLLGKWDNISSLDGSEKVGFIVNSKATEVHSAQAKGNK